MGGVRGDSVAADCFRNEFSCQFSTFVRSHDPQRVVARVDVDEYVQVKPHALGGPAEFGDVPGPDL